METKKVLESAFPLPKDRSMADNGKGGMSKRFYAACAAMQGLLANPNCEITEHTKPDLISVSYYFADELLRQEEQ